VEPLIALFMQLNNILVKESVIEALGNIGDIRAIPTLTACLKDEKIRSFAVIALGKFDDNSVVNPLIIALHIKSIRQTAISSLVKIGSPSVKALIDNFYDVDVRDSVIEVLLKIGRPAETQLIATLMDWYAFRREIAALVLEKMGWRPGNDEAGMAFQVIKRNWEECLDIGTPAVGPLILAFQTDDKTRKETADILGKIGDSRAIEPLVSTLNDKDTAVIEAVKNALVKIGIPAVEPLIAVLINPDKNVKIAAAEILGEIGDSRSIGPLTTLLKNEDWSVRLAGTRALGKIGDSLAVGSIIAVLKDEFDLVREAGAEALGEINDDKAIKPLIESLININDKRMHKAVIKALEKLNWKPDQDEASAVYWCVKENWQECVRIGSPAVKPLIDALKQTNEIERQSIIDVLSQIGTSAVESLIWALKDKNNPRGKSYIAEVLGHMNDGRAIEPLFDMLKDDNSYNQRVAANALINLYKAKPIDDKFKNLIFSHRSEISMPHEDIHDHTDHNLGENYSSHTDLAFIEFPL
jgi:HEAT repeat protein